MSTHTPATWGTRLGFILASAGSAVGLGAIWKFPYMAGTNGGSVFMLPYIFFTLTVGVALLLAEFAMGRAGRRGAVGSLNRAAGKPWGIFGGIGVFCALSFGPLSDWKLFGRTLFDLLDYATSNIGMPIGCVGIGLVAAWVAWPTIRKQLEMNAKWSAAGLKAFRILAGCAAPILILIVAAKGAGLF